MKSKTDQTTFRRIEKKICRKPKKKLRISSTYSMMPFIYLANLAVEHFVFDIIPEII